MNIKDLINANKNEISFFNSTKYIDLLNKTKAKYIITNLKYKNIFNKNQCPLFVNNVLLSVSKVTKFLYPDSLNDAVDLSLGHPKKKIIKKLNLVKMFLLEKM